MRKLPFMVLWLGLAWALTVILMLLQAAVSRPASPSQPRFTSSPAGPPPEATEVLAEARRVEEHTENQVSLIVTLMEVFIGAVALVAIILTGIGLREWKHVSEKAEATLESADTKVTQTLEDIEVKVTNSVEKSEDAARRAQAAAERGQDLISALEKDTEEAKRKAEEATRLAEKASQTADESSRQIDAMKNSLVEAWSGEIGKAFADLPDLEAEWQFMFKARSLAPEVPVQFEDLDALFVICDRLKIPAEAEVMVDGLLQLGRYWRVVAENFPRAMVRVDRALALASTEVLERRCRLHRARVSIQWATYNQDDQRLQRLASAREDLERVRQIQGRDDSATLFERAWIADEEERFDAAVELWRQAREEDLKESQGDPPDLWLYSFNLACSLSQGDRPQEALEELRALMGLAGNVEEWIQMASTDPDLEKLRGHSEWGRAFEELLKQARQRD